MKFQAVLSKSNRPAKKYMVDLLITDPEYGETRRKIHFGASGMEDYTIHKDEERKRKYINRHSQIYLKDGSRAIDSILSPAFWAMNLLWNKPTLTESIGDLKKKYKIEVSL